MTLNFQRFDSAEALQEQRQLFSECFPEARGSGVESIEHYHWKFKEFPAPQSSYEYCAYEEDRLVGYYAAIPYSYMINGTKMCAGMVCDVMTHPDMRGKGVFRKLGEYATGDLLDSGLDFTTGYPIRPEVIPGHLKVGWKIVFDLPLYLRCVDSGAILAEKNIGFLSPLVNVGVSLVNATFNFLTPKPKEQVVIDAYSLDAFFESVDYAEFFSRWAERQKYYLLKDESFLRWRLGSKEADYKIYVLRVADRVEAIAITRLCDLKGIPALAILDFMTTTQRVSSLGVLHRALEKQAKENGAAVIAGMFSKHLAKTLKLFRYGYLKTPLSFKLIIKSLKISIPEEEFYREDNWSLMWIDSDDL